MIVEQSCPSNDEVVEVGTEQIHHSVEKSHSIDYFNYNGQINGTKSCLLIIYTRNSSNPQSRLSRVNAPSIHYHVISLLTTFPKQGIEHEASNNKH